MPTEIFAYKDFHAASYGIIRQANEIIAEYQAAGFKLTLRQLYYQFVARDLFTRKYRWTGSRYVRDQDKGTINAQPNYDNLGVLISEARLAGLIDWDAIEDRTRFLRGVRTFDDPADAIEETRKRYAIDMWEGQTKRIEVWIEKDALIGVVERVCNKWNIDFFACRGYASQSELYAAGKRIAWRKKHQGLDTVVLHLGDHDPSGIDMTRDNEDRLSMFARMPVQVNRIALNLDQIEQYDPPANPAKLTDSRAPAYVQEFGDDSWELDALEPSVIAELIEANATEFINMSAWELRKQQLRRDREVLDSAISFVSDLSQN